MTMEWGRHLIPGEQRCGLLGLFLFSDEVCEDCRKPVSGRCVNLFGELSDRKEPRNPEKDARKLEIQIFWEI